MSVTVFRPEFNNRLAEEWTRVESCGHPQNKPPQPPPMTSLPPRPPPRSYRNIIVTSLGAAVVLTGLAILAVYLVLMPHKPRFVLRDITVQKTKNDPSFSNLLTRTLQVTLTSRNPNDRIGIVYDKLDLYASYRSRQFTLAVDLPPSYLGRHNDVVEWSPFVVGSAVAVTKELSLSLEQDLMAKKVLLEIKVKGTLRWKVGTWVSPTYRVFVTCPVYVTFGEESRNGVVRSKGSGFEVAQGCLVDVSIGGG